MAEQSQSKTAITVIVVIATSLLMVFLVREMIRYTTPAPVGAERALARAKDNAEIRATGQEGLRSYGYADPAKGIVRIPIEEAMKMTVQEYKNPAAFHANISNRLEKAFPPPPPAGPAPKNEYE